MYIRELKSDEIGLFKSLRMRAYADAPHAFQYRYDQVRDLTEAEWLRQFQEVTAPSLQRMYIAFEDAEPIGCAMAMIKWADETHGVLRGLWVDPIYRRRGVGLALLRKVMEWGRMMELARLEASLTPSNNSMMTMLRLEGFEPLPGFASDRVRLYMNAPFEPGDDDDTDDLSGGDPAILEDPSGGGGQGIAMIPPDHPEYEPEESEDESEDPAWL